MKRLFLAILVVIFATPTVWANDSTAPTTPCVTSEAITAEEMECVDSKMAQVDSDMNETALEAKTTVKTMKELKIEGGFQTLESQKKLRSISQRLGAIQHGRIGLE